MGRIVQCIHIYILSKFNSKEKVKKNSFLSQKKKKKKGETDRIRRRSLTRNVMLSS